MKKIIMMLFIVLSFINIINVDAQTDYPLVIEHPEEIYYVRTGPNYYKSSQFAIYRLRGVLAYCIEPTKQITTYSYVDKDNYLNLNYPDDVKEKLELIGYYGREYPSHDNIRYSMAAQALIWEVSASQNVTFWTKKNGEGEEIDVSKEKNEILNLVNNHKRMPNIKENIEGIINKEIVLNDSLNVLSTFKITDNGGNEVRIEDNKLIIVPKVGGVSTIKLEKVPYDNLPLLTFVGKEKDTQTLARLRYSNNSKMSFNINLNTSVSRVKLVKMDNDGNIIKISNIKFKIRNVDTNSYVCENSECIFKTDSNGSFITNSYLSGNYEVEEVKDQIVPGYLWNKEKLKFSINSSSNIIEDILTINFKNKKVYGNITITKYGEKLDTSNKKIEYVKIKLSNIKFNLYDKNDNLIRSGITDNNGKLLFDKLEIGDYYIKEDSNNSDYITNDRKYYVFIKQENQYDDISINLDIDNYLEKGSLLIKKIDSISYEGISNTLIGIYDKDDNLVISLLTDKDGIIKINDLPKGEYYIKELESNKLYLLSNEVINFVINNDNVTNLVIKNEKISGSVILKKSKEVLNIDKHLLNYDYIDANDIEFDLYKDDIFVNSFKTNNEGIIKIDNLEVGNYYFKEKYVDNNYLEDNNKYYFEINKDNYKEEVKINVINYLKKGNLTIKKVDSDTKEGISNTFIGLYDMNNNLLLTDVTDSNGVIKINNMMVGNYVIKEIDSNYYYELSNKKYPITINYQDNISITMENKKILGKVELLKLKEEFIIEDNINSFLYIPFSGIRFDLYKDDVFVNSYITDNDGLIKVGDLEIGNYYFKEVYNDSKYVSNNEKYKFTIGRENYQEVQFVSAINYLKKGNLLFKKMDSKTLEGIDNTVVEIYDDMNNLLLTKTTNQEGIIEINGLVQGKYYLIEKTPNKSYKLSNEIIYFDILDNNVTYSKMVNEKNEINIPKTGRNDNILVNSISGILLLISLGCKYYEKKTY